MIRRLIILFLYLTPLISFSQKKSLIFQLRYERNKYELSNQNKQVLSIIADTLIGKTNYVIYINGHTDSDADSSYNQQLSLKRSLAVKDYFVEKGFDESIIRVQAKGEEQPIVSNSTPLEKAKNRRVEIVILFSKKSEEKIVETKKGINEPNCNEDTTVIMEGGYVLTMSICDWKKNSECLHIIKRFKYEYIFKENWLKRHIGFKNYLKTITYEPHYEFDVVSCWDSCFKNKIKLYIPQYDAPGFKLTEKYTQKKNNKNQSTTLTFKKAKIGDSVYYVANIYCPGAICGNHNGCYHLIKLYAKNKITILSYSYNTRGYISSFDTLLETKTINSNKLIDSYDHTFFRTLSILYKGDTITFENIPIDIFAHGIKKIKRKRDYIYYFMFVPYHKNYKCGHYKKYKIRPKDIEKLKQFNINDLQMEK